MASLDHTSNQSGYLIAAKQVQGATVFNTEMEKLGTLEDVMIDKATGRIAYAILAHGGFLGIGDRYYPIPWEKLKYNTEMDGYVVDIGHDVLQGAPSYTDEAAASWRDDAWTRGVHSYYGVHPFRDVMP